jgi:multiple sugar transport system permease protein
LEKVKKPRLSDRERAGFWFILPAMIFVLLFFIIPLISVVVMSTTDFPLLGDITYVGFQNYIDMFQDTEFHQTIIQTLIYTVLVTPPLFIVGLGTALLIRRVNRLSSFFRTFFFMPIVIGFGSAAFLWYWLLDPGTGYIPQLLRDLGFGSMEKPILGYMPGALIAVILMVVWKFSSLQMILLMAGMQGIDNDVIESSEIDGAVKWKQLRFITLPLIRRTLAMVFILSIAGSLLAFDQFFIMTGGGPEGQTETMVFFVWRQAFRSFNLGYAAALSVAIAIVLLLVSVVQLKLLDEKD